MLGRFDRSWLCSNAFYTKATSLQKSFGVLKTWCSSHLDLYEKATPTELSIYLGLEWEQSQIAEAKHCAYRRTKSVYVGWTSLLLENEQ